MHPVLKSIISNAVLLHISSMNYSSFMSSSSSEERDWAGLPQNVLFMIISQLFLLSDVFSFGSVCTCWNSVLEHRLRKLNIKSNMSFKRGLPMLLTPTDDSSENTRNLYSIPDAVIYDLKLPVPFNNRCIGSSHGWLIFLDSLSFVITLFNPFYFGSSKGTICLPPFVPAEDIISKRMKEHKDKFFSDYFICKAILSSDPSSCTNGYILMVIYGEMRSLAYYNSKDLTWVCIDSDEAFFDIIYHQDNFLAINLWGQAYICELKSNFHVADPATEPVMGPVGGATRRYLMKASGSAVLQVVRLVDCTMSRTDTIFNTRGFLVYKLVMWGDKLEWIPLSMIGDGALFVGDNYSTFVKASDYPGVMCNAIYFTADYCDTNSMFYAQPYFNDQKDSGIYRVTDETFHPHYISGSDQKNRPPPIWILPTI